MNPPTFEGYRTESYFSAGGLLGYTPHEGPNLTNENSRKLVVFDRKLEGSHSLYYGYHRVMVNYC